MAVLPDGYNAALVAEIVGDDGLVVTVDIDPEVTARAIAALHATGYGRVVVRTGDGETGAEDLAPFDALLITAGAWDIPPSWTRQLVVGGRLVVPLRWGGQTRAVAFTLDEEGVLRSDSVDLCGFVPMQGAGAGGELTAPLAPEGSRLVYDSGQMIDPVVVRAALNAPGITEWSGRVLGGNESIDGVWLRIAVEAGGCRIVDERTGPGIALRTAALVDGDSVAYLTHRPAAGASNHEIELGAAGHGPDGGRLARHILGLIEAWDRDRAAVPVVTAYPASTPDDQLAPGPVFVKRHRRVQFAYPADPTR